MEKNTWITSLKKVPVSQLISDPEILEAARDHIATRVAQYRKLAAESSVPGIDEILADWEAMTPERLIVEQRRRKRDEAAADLSSMRRDRQERWQVFVAQHGRRYARCRLGNFRAEIPKQQAALDTVRAYDREMPERVKAGEGLLLHGPCGVGKDHLLTGLARRAIVHRGIRVRWISGADLERICRASLSEDSGADARAEIEHCKRVPVLILSDPCPGGAPTPFQLTSLTEVLDYRYNHMLPTWAAVNAANRADLEGSISERLVDRLRDGATVIPMVWPSHRAKRA